jgi:hypothetical protein
MGLPSMAEGLVGVGVGMALGAGAGLFGVEGVALGVDGIALSVVIDGAGSCPSSLPHALSRDSATAALSPIRCKQRSASERVICPCWQFSAISSAR